MGPWAGRAVFYVLGLSSLGTPVGKKAADGRRGQAAHRPRALTKPLLSSEVGGWVSGWGKDTGFVPLPPPVLRRDVALHVLEFHIHTFNQLHIGSRRFFLIIIP